MTQGLWVGLGLTIEVFHIIFAVACLLLGHLWMNKDLVDFLRVGTLVSWPITMLITNAWTYCPITALASVCFSFGGMQSPFPQLFDFIPWGIHKLG